MYAAICTFSFHTNLRTMNSFCDHCLTQLPEFSSQNVFSRTYAPYHLQPKGMVEQVEEKRNQLILISPT